MLPGRARSAAPPRAAAARIAPPRTAAARVAPALLIAAGLIFLPSAAHGGPAPAQGDPVTIAVAVKAGWNIVSLPVSPAAHAKDSLFPSSVSEAYGFDDGYVPADTLSGGAGYWLKFTADESVPVTGGADLLRTIGLRAGWNLVGGISTATRTGSLTTIPAGILASEFFLFDPDSGYRATGTLLPGAGYWVKSSQAGSLVLRSFDAPCPGVSPFVYAGHTYHSVQIAEQCWLRENLNVGAMVASIFDHMDDGIVQKYCWNEDTNNCRIYGALYQWDEAMDWSTAPRSRGICPPGWHIPDMAEMLTLDTVTGGDGNMLKAVYQGSGDGTGTNVTGFSALLSPYRQWDAFWSTFGLNAYFWTSTEQGPSTAGTLYLFNQHADLYFPAVEKVYGFGVRCLRD